MAKVDCSYGCSSEAEARNSFIFGKTQLRGSLGFCPLHILGIVTFFLLTSEKKDSPEASPESHDVDYTLISLRSLGPCVVIEDVSRNIPIGLCKTKHNSPPTQPGQQHTS